uniref:ATP synthase F0 subunit 6 n=1 Tax=Megacopta caliginosa TaxID=2968962 RepID=UPI0022375C07|nr:ATP synthase F0 subunit 6 [Megacopta caliginosa]UYA97672.1 ATP synthase F0 subunit 6 [Megacopta caliginosa]
MMTNLFSTFDPATSIKVSMNWMSTFIGIMMIPMAYWTLPNRTMMLTEKISMKLHEEMKMLLGKSSNSITLMMISMFMFIFYNNIMGLLPYVFTSSSHLAFSMTLALPMWVSIMMFGWINHTNHMFAHLVPSGTPSALMPFMVIIETISNVMRPGSLAVRLTANMIAGHLLMSLLGNNSVSANSIILPMIMMIQVGLMMFEMAVAIIQAYVFSVLSTLYTSEVM